MQCFVCQRQPGQVELAHCELCEGETFLCTDCDAGLREDIRRAAALLWKRRHVHIQGSLRHQLKLTANRVRLAMDELHVARVELEACQLPMLSRKLSEALRPIEEMHGRVRTLACEP